ncbi:Immunoglobulin I-set, partial [Trinorchestia longiramus]
RPITTLRVGLQLNPSSVREGSDVFFECSIQANPPMTAMFFLHKNETIHHNVSARVIVSNQTLVLQSVARQQTGPYRCGARNSVGVGVSEPIILHVL